MSVYATSNFANYGKPDKQEKQRKRFMREIQSEYGAHSSELKNYWQRSNSWRNLLVCSTKEERKQIFLDYLDMDILQTASAKDIDEAFEKINPYISSVSKRALLSFFENQDAVHKAMGAIKTVRPSYGLTIYYLAQDILFWESKMFKINKCPAILWEENRIELFEIPCEDDDHRADCKQYHQDGETTWLDREKVLNNNKKKISKFGLRRKKFITDEAKLKELKFKAIGNLISSLKKEPDYSYDKLTETLASIEWSHPEIYLKPDLQELWKFTTEEKAFCEEFFEIYDVEVHDNYVLTSLKKTERSY